jgi:putative endonuclease
MDDRRALGFSGESAAQKYLTAQGYQIIGKNFRTRCGEIDLIAKHGDVFVFVEVKTRTSSAYGMPEEAVTRTKQRHLILAAQIYLSKFRHVNVNWRIDVLGLLQQPDGSWQVRHIPNAVQGW